MKRNPSLEKHRSYVFGDRLPAPHCALVGLVGGEGWF